MTGLRIDSLFDIIDCSDNLETEIIKSCLIKALIQIDRSRNASDGALVAECAHYMGIEARVNRQVSDRLLRRARILTDMI